MKQHHTSPAGYSGSSALSTAEIYYPKRLLGRLRKERPPTQCATESVASPIGVVDVLEPDPIVGIEIHVICIYPSVRAGKLARQWIETALHTTLSNHRSMIEYFNYAVLSHDGISWPHVIERIHPDIILMVGDGSSQLDAGLRHSLRALLTYSSNGSKPLVIFRDLEPEPTINTRTLLDYVSALTQKNNCELNATNGNGNPISSFRHPHHLLKSRKHHE